MGRSLRLVWLVVCLTLATCADASGPGSARTPGGTGFASPGFPLTVQAANGSVTLAHRPDRIVSLSPTATEMLFAIGAGDQVVAVDDESNYPAEAPTTDLSGYEPNAEAIAAYEPDLVVYANDLGDVESALDRLGIAALLQPAAANLRAVYAQIEQLGRVTAHGAAAHETVRSMRTRIASVVASTRPPTEPLTFYHELDDTYYSVTSSTFIGRIYSLLGLRNIADAADADGSGYPQLSPEYIVEADPDLIFLADTKCCGQSASTVRKRPGWNAISAVRHGSIVELNDDVASRWGPRIVQLLQTVARAVDDAEARAA